MSKENLDLFFNSLMTDLELQQTLMKLDSFDNFSQLAQKIGQERGYDFTLEEMETYIKEEMFPSSMDESQETEETWPETAKPWLQFISQLKWAKGKNKKLWERFL